VGHELAARDRTLALEIRVLNARVKVRIRLVRESPAARLRRAQATAVDGRSLRRWLRGHRLSRGRNRAEVMRAAGPTGSLVDGLDRRLMVPVVRTAEATVQRTVVTALKDEAGMEDLLAHR